jgi:tetratricopeptide (TPR) repeat protein
VPREAPKCANGGCTKQGLHRCGGCKSVMYCSAACQKVHWKQGGHKQECKKPAAQARPAGVATVGASAAVGVGGSCEGSCIICLDGDPRPIQSGCACRGDAGLSHVECRAKDAAHRTKNRGDVKGWWECGTCGQRFTGAMKLGLAEAWWSTAQRLPEEGGQRLKAAVILATALNGQGRNAEAETMHREVLVVQRRVLGQEHPDTLTTAGNLASSLDSQGRYSEAESLYREVLVVQRRVLGPEHPDTLTTAGNLASSLDDQGRCSEAETMHREVLVVRRRVLGPEHPHTLVSANNLAGALNDQGRDAEAEAVFCEVLVVQRRVLGPEHPNTLMTAGNLANVLFTQGDHAEAERMFREVLVVQRRVLGPEHPDMLWTNERLEACVRFARGTRGSAK